MASPVVQNLTRFVVTRNQVQPKTLVKTNTLCGSHMYWQSILFKSQFLLFPGKLLMQTKHGLHKNISLIFPSSKRAAISSLSQKQEKVWRWQRKRRCWRNSCSRSQLLIASLLDRRSWCPGSGCKITIGQVHTDFLVWPLITFSCHHTCSFHYRTFFFSFIKKQKHTKHCSTYKSIHYFVITLT